LAKRWFFEFIQFVQIFDEIFQQHHNETDESEGKHKNDLLNSQMEEIIENIVSGRNTWINNMKKTDPSLCLSNRSLRFDRLLRVTELTKARSFSGEYK
jgi:hypothetical protein